MSFFKRKRKYVSPYESWKNSLSGDAKKVYEEAQTKRMENKLRKEKITQRKLELQEQELEVEAKKLELKKVRVQDEINDFQDGNIEEMGTEDNDLMTDIVGGVVNAITNKGTKEISANNDGESVFNPHRINANKETLRKKKKVKEKDK